MMTLSLIFTRSMFDFDKFIFKLLEQISFDDTKEF